MVMVVHGTFLFGEVLSLGIWNSGATILGILQAEVSSAKSANHARLDDARRGGLLLTEMLPTAIALVMSRRPSFCLPQRCAFHARGGDLSMRVRRNFCPRPEL